MTTDFAFDNQELASPVTGIEEVFAKILAEKAGIELAQIIDEKGKLNLLGRDLSTLATNMANYPSAEGVEVETIEKSLAVGEKLISDQINKPWPEINVVATGRYLDQIRTEMQQRTAPEPVVENNFVNVDG